MEAETGSKKWEGKVSAGLPIPTTAAQVWPFLEDFCNLHKWLPSVDTCYQVDGISGQPGMIRYCAATITVSSTSSGRDEKMIKWAKEKLLTIDPIKRCLSYEILDNNIGLKSYVATMIVLPIDGDGIHGCKIEWSFVSDPIEGWRLEDWVSFLEPSLRSMAKNIQDALLLL
jgi:hypothetical protein